MSSKVLAVAIGLVVISALSGCNKDPVATTVAAPKISAPKVEGDAITFAPDSPQLNTLVTIEALKERESFVRINGRTSWDETRTARIFTPLAGRIVDIKASPGETVKRGEVLATISSPDFGMTQAESRRAQTELTLTDKQLQRARDLVGAGVLPQKDLQLAEADFARAKNERERTLAREQAYGANAKIIDQKFALTTPISGVVVDRRLTPGQEIRPDQAPDQPFFTVSDPTRLWVLLDVPESLTKEIEAGEQVRISVPALPGEVFIAQVEYVADYIDAQSRTVKARAAVDNSNRRLKAEMYVTADVGVPPSKALKVPTNAVYLLGNKYFTFVEQPKGTFTRREIKAEEATLGFVRITAGVISGERLVSDGALLLQQFLNNKASAPVPASAAVKQ